MRYKPTMISPSCIFLSSFVSTCRFVCIVPSEVIAQLAVSRPKFLFKSHPGVPTCSKELKLIGLLYSAMGVTN